MKISTELDDILLNMARAKGAMQEIAIRTCLEYCSDFPRSVFNEINKNKLNALPFAKRYVAKYCQLKIYHGDIIEILFKGKVIGTIYP